MSVDTLLSTAKDLCDAHLRQSLQSKSTLASRLTESCHYSLFAGGKRIRPALCYSVAQSFSSELEKVTPIAAALECIHTYSLIHDDLPAMDDDDLRRGKATNHKAFDEATAILAGDALLTLAFDILSEASWALDADKKIKIISILSQKSGANGMVGGQMLDLIHENNPHLSKEQLESIHLGKTAALLQASLLCPAIALGLSSDIQKDLQDIALSLGLAFQVADDILDITQSSETLGKNAHSDLDNLKSTYPSILGLEQSKTIMHDLYYHALEKIDQLRLQDHSLKQLAQFIIERKS